MPVVNDVKFFRCRNLFRFVFTSIVGNAWNNGESLVLSEARTRLLNG